MKEMLVLSKAKFRVTVGNLNNVLKTKLQGNYNIRNIKAPAII